MAIPRIRRFGDACLRCRAQSADVDAPETRSLLDTLWAVLEDDGGVGLSAPQIGVDQRVAVVRWPDRPEGRQRLDLVNPEIRETYGPDDPFEEGCLSFPGLYASVLRPKGIKLEYAVCGEAERRTLRDDDLLARIIQHEVDHLDGRLFIDHLPRWRRWWHGPRLLWIMAGRLFRQ